MTQQPPPTTHTDPAKPALPRKLTRRRCRCAVACSSAALAREEGAAPTSTALLCQVCTAECSQVLTVAAIGMQFELHESAERAHEAEAFALCALCAVGGPLSSSSTANRHGSCERLWYLLRYSRYTSTLRTLRTLHSALHFALHFLYLHTSSAAVDHPPNEFSVLQTVQAVYVPENYATYAIHSARPQGLIAKQKTRG